MKEKKRKDSFLKNQPHPYPLTQNQNIGFQGLIKSVKVLILSLKDKIKASYCCLTSSDQILSKVMARTGYSLMR